MLEYAFMQRGLLAGLLLGAVIPLVGMTIVQRRLSMIGDALSHASLAGVAAGLVGGVSPIAGAIVACLVGTLCIEGARRGLRDQAELAVAIILAAGVGTAGVLSGFVPNASSLNSYLFGSILTMSNDEVATIVAVCAVTLFTCGFLRRSLFLMAFDERQARTAGVAVETVNLAFMVVVAVASRTVGSLIVSSMMVVPVACGLEMARSWRQACILSSLAGVAATALGLVASYYLGLRPGGTIVLIAIALLVLAFVGRRLVGRA